jgi:cytochrome P450
MSEAFQTERTTPISRWQNRPRPPAPEPLNARPGPLQTLRILRTNPIEGLLEEHFEQPFTIARTVVGTIAFVNEPNAIRHVLIDNAANYQRDRIQRKMLTVYGPNLLVAEGDDWRNQRRQIGRAFTPKMVADFTAPMTDAALALTKQWETLGAGSRIDLALEMRRATIRLLERTLFPGGFDRDLDETIKHIRRQFELVARVSLLDLLNMPNWIPRIVDFRLRPIFAFFEAMAADLIASRERLLEDPAAAPPNDFLTALLQPSEQRSGRALTRAEIAGNIFMLFAAGHETSASALCWAFYLLALDDEWRERLEAEADRELPDGRFVEGSLDRLIETKAVIEETLRLYPPIATLNRQAVGADRLGDLKIAPGTFVVVAPWVLHRHRRLWEMPDHFDPSRFLPGARDNIHRFSYLPFGAGPRVCVGASFGTQAFTILLATIVRRFKLELAPDSEVWPVHRVTLHPERGPSMILRPRWAN